MIWDRWSRAKKNRWWVRALRAMLAGYYWRRCRICGEGYNIDREMGVRPHVKEAGGEIVCWWCAWEGRDGALPWMVSYISENQIAMPEEYFKEPLRTEVLRLLANHILWRKSVLAKEEA